MECGQEISKKPNESHVLEIRPKETNESRKKTGYRQKSHPRPGVPRKQRKSVNYESCKHLGSQLQSMKNQDEDCDGEIPPFRNWNQAQNSGGSEHTGGKRSNSWREAWEMEHLVPPNRMLFAKMFKSGSLCVA